MTSLVPLFTDTMRRTIIYQTGRCVRTIENAHPHFVTCMVAHPVAPIIVSGGVDKSIKVWNCR
jgi:platelet-activating factor acetylhydrolase IB subunit alpha